MHDLPQSGLLVSGRDATEMAGDHGVARRGHVVTSKTRIAIAPVPHASSGDRIVRTAMSTARGRSVSQPTGARMAEECRLPLRKRPNTHCFGD